MHKEHLDFLATMVNNLEQGTLQLEEAYRNNDMQNVVRIKAYIERIQKTIGDVLNG